MKLVRSIRSQLFLCYASIILFTVVGIALAFYFYTADILERRAAESLQAISSSISLSLDSEIKRMDEESRRIISSEGVKEAFFQSDPSDFNKPQFRTDLFHLLFSSYPTMNYQVNLFGTENTLIQYGRIFDITTQDYREIYPEDWFEDCLALEGQKQVTGIHRNHAGYQVISLSRAFSESFFNTPYNSVIEVQQYYQIFENMILDALSSSSIQAYVFDESGELIYPLEPENPDSVSLYQQLISQEKNTSGTLSLKQQEKEILSFSKSGITNWTVAVCESERSLLDSVTRFRNQMILIGIGVLLITLIVTFLIARHLTIPIKKIRDSIAHLNLVALSEQPILDDKPHSSELELLYSSYFEMVERLEHSLDDIVSIRSHEIQAQMLALQAQMNPHFLYNTVTTISILADNNHQPEIVKMCESLTAMLRYIVNGSTKPVTMSAELDYLNQYLVLMKCRYPEQLQISIQVMDDMLDIYVPKLVIQPIIENCFKYAFDIRPPWKVVIKGWVDNGRWRLSVSDNGVGFSRETLDWLEQKISEESIQFVQKGSDRTGLLNIFYRLKILYQDEAVFRIENLPERGSIVTIGGLILNIPPDNTQ